MTAENAALQELLDKNACQEVLIRYARALDWVDEEALKTVFFPDAEIDYGFFTGRGDEFIPVVIELERGFLRRWHNNGPALITLSGDVAEAESYGLAAAVSRQDGQTVTNVFGGRYLDRLERRDGQWGIAKRQYLLDWQRSFEMDAANEAVPGLPWLDGAAPDHPLYRRL